jgi:DNA (cytosine-5)-methyltransferase 1
MTIRFGSVCSGIEAASVAWHPLGWQAAWLSEIEAFPSAVLKHHYPDVPNLGDMTTLPERIRSGEVEAPDLFCGGTPCQAFSVAGLRKSLDDARGNLSLVFCEIANAIDSIRTVRGEQPAVIFWENVPGVLSTKDNAFGCFLAGLAGETDPVEPPRGKWTNAGVVLGPQRAVAWRILDAQYFGVAQRRRRVFVVASARDGFDPAAVLFEFDGVRRDTAPSREARQKPAGTLEASLGRSRGAGTPAAAIVEQPYELGNTLTARMHKGMNSDCNEVQTPVLQPMPFGVGESPDTAHCLRSGASKADKHESTTYVAQPIAFNARQDPDSWTGRTGPLDTDGCTQAVAQPMPINTMVALRHKALGEGTGFGIGEAGDPAYTLTKGHSHAVAQPMVLMDQGGSVMNVNTDGTVGTLRRETHGHEPVVMQPVAAFKGGQGSGAGGIGYSEYVAPTLPASDGGNRTPTLLNAMQVRRLTPVECERLQGFPDNYTAIPWRKKPASECPDGPRYKALGNSWAVPVVRWIGCKIHNAIVATTNIRDAA